jgi:hypothetical protein
VDLPSSDQKQGKNPPKAAEEQNWPSLASSSPQRHVEPTAILGNTVGPWGATRLSFANNCMCHDCFNPTWKMFLNIITPHGSIRFTSLRSVECLESLGYLKKYLVYLIFQIWTTHIPTFQPRRAEVLVVPRAGHSFRTDPRLTGSLSSQPK